MINHRSSSWTGRTHRTMESAFGPYASGPIHPMPEPRRRFWQDVALYVVVLIAILAVIHFANN